MATATKKADWKALKKFMASVGEPTRDQWDELSEQAEQFDDYTSSLAVEYLALFEPSEDETTDNAFCPTGKQPPVPGKPVVPPAKPKGVPQPSLNEEGIENGSNPSSDLHKAGEWLSEQGLAMPGYGQIFLKENGSGEVWYVGGDGDEDGFATLVNKTLTKVEGIDEVTYESEGFPPRDGTWLQVYPEKQEWTENAFCPTGKGGGIDPTCSPGKGKAGTTPCPEPCYNPKPDKNKSRVGVPADEVPPPPKIGRIPNLNAKERAVESNFIEAYESDPDNMAAGFRSLITDSTPPGQPKVFGTDDAKVLTDAWGGDDMGIRSVNRATMNVALHQTANAIAKRAFVQELDSLKPGDEIMVTVGGCGAGKGYALKNVPQALEAKGKSKVVWDSAGDQNATENAWIQKEAEKRGLKATYVFVHADPKVQWADPNRGVVKRAGDPNDGRMVDAKVFADSYAHGAKNHNNFYKANKDNPNARFLFLENGAQPKLLPGIPKEALKYKSDDLESFAVDAVKKSGAPKHVQDGALIGQRLWN